MRPQTRHKARSLAVQALYEWSLSGREIYSIESQFLAEQNLKRVDVKYFRALLQGVTEQIETIDQEIKPFLNRSLESLTPVELAVLRLAVFELAHRPDIPYRVVINEALELSKQFGAEDGFKFVNGILDKVAKKLRVAELTAPEEKAAL